MSTDFVQVHPRRLKPFRSRYFLMNKSWLSCALGWLIAAPFVAAHAGEHPDRRPLSGVQKSALATGDETTAAIRLKSETFLPDGNLETNWRHAHSLAPGEKRIHVLVRFASRPDDALQKRLTAQGLKLTGYLPERTYFASVPADLPALRLAELGINWVGAIYPGDKMPARLRTTGVGEWARRENDTDDLRVTFHTDTDSGDARRAGLGFGAHELGWNAELRQWTINLPAKNFAALAALDTVRWVEEVPPPPTTMNDGMRANTQADIAQAPPYNLSGAGVTVGEFDVGYADPKQGDLVGRITLGETGSTVNFHSTHVAGILAGDGSLSTVKGGTNRQWRGVAPAAKIVSYVYTDSVAKHKEAINKYGISISQNSWGHIVGAFFGNCDLYGDYSMDAPGFDQIVHGLYGSPISVVFAAGNARNNFDTNGCGAGPYNTIGPPGTGKNVITVGAINSDDSSMTAFSSWGPTDDGRLKPELVAPGSQNTGDGGITSTSPGNTYRVLRGTSMAAPAVSGALALLIEDYRARFNGEDPLPSTLRGLLVHTAEDLDDDTSWHNPGPDFASGYGRLQIADAIDQLRANAFLVGQVGHGETNTYILPVREGLIDAKVTLVWDDPAAAENAASALVNDLDLIVLDPDGTRAFPWTLDPANPSADAVRTKEDHLNTIEQVQVDVFGNAGNWTVQVVGHNVPVNSPQKYSLIFSPATIPAPPNLIITGTSFGDSFTGGGNSNGVIDPGEIILERVALRNTDGLTASNVTALLQTTTPGVTMLQSRGAYPNLPPGYAGTNLDAFTYRVGKEVACGTPIEFTHVSTANGFVYTNYFTRTVGQVRVTGTSSNQFAAVPAAGAIPDGGTLVATNFVNGPGTLLNVAVTLRLDHEFVGDLQIDLMHPDGTRVSLVAANSLSGQNFGSGLCADPSTRLRFADDATNSIRNGIAPFEGSFRPEGMLNSLLGKPMSGQWQLVVSDVSLEDTGQLFCWSLELVAQQTAFICSAFDPVPLAFDQDITVAADTGTLLHLSGSFEATNATFQIDSPPAHGTIGGFDPALGVVTYFPEPGYHGADEFSFHVNDGATHSAPATVRIKIEIPSAELSITQTFAPLAVRLGDELTYTISVYNAGPNTATGVTFSDELPWNTAFISATAESGSFSFEQGALNGDLPDLPPGGTATVKVVVKPVQIGIVTNTVNIAAKQADTHPEDNSATSTTRVNLETDLGVSKSAAAGVVLVGSEFTYSVTLTNLGPNPATNIVLKESMPRNVTFVSATPTRGLCFFFNGLLTCALDDLAVGGSETFTVVIVSPVPGKLVTTATIRSDGVDLDPGNDLSLLTVQVRSGADLRVTQSVSPSPAALNRDLTWLFTVRNDGPNDATGVTLTDILPDSLTVQSITSSQGVCTNAGGVLSCDLGNLAKGRKANITVVTTPTQLGSLTNSVSVSGSEFDPITTNNVATVSTEVNLDADLALTLAVSTSVAVVGEPLTYTFGVTNRGPNTATNVLITDVLPPGVGVVAAQASQGTARTDNGTLVFDLGNLPAGASATATLIATPPAVGSLTNVASVAANETDLHLRDNSAAVITRVNQIADLSVSLAASPDPSIYGNFLRYTVTVTNLGPQTANGIRLSQVLPVKANFDSANLSQGSFFRQSNILTCNFGTLESLASATATITINPLAVGLISSTARVSANETDPHPENNFAAITTRVIPFSDLAIGIQSTPVPIGANHELTYLVSVQNLGPNPAADVVIIDRLTPDMIFVRAEVFEGNCTNENGVVSCNVGGVPVGGTATAAIYVKPTRVGWLTNEVSVDAQVIDLFSFNNEASIVSDVQADADVVVSVTGAPGVQSIGSNVVFQIAVTNRGVLPAGHVLLTNDVPANAELQSVQLSHGAFTTQPGSIVCELGDLPPGEGATLTIEVKPLATGSLTNVARAGTTDFEFDTRNNSAAAAVEILPSADLTISAVAAPDPVPIGKLFTYTITVTNLGPTTAANVVLTGAVPSTALLASSQASQGTCTIGDSAFTCRLGTLTNGASATVTLVMDPLAAGFITNIFAVSGRVIDPDGANNSVAVSNLISPALDLFVTQIANPDPVLIGENFVYQITVSNRTDRLVPAVTVFDTLPPGVNFISANASQGLATHNDGTVIFQLGDLDVESGATLAIQAAPTQTGSLTNRLAVVSRGADSPQASLFSNLTHAVVETPTLSFERVGARLVLTWPSAARAFTLEVANSLSPTEIWSVERSPRVTSAGTVTVTVKLSASARFYRLRKQ
ncbi:MAG: DUF11 domain-containing protein [Verrucomicrobia bacterium]|nr:DUF11 domain-containing protein [Verrucomicrobiota bacterium]